MTQLFEINVKLSENQKKNIRDAYRKRETIVIRLTNNSLRGNDTLYVPEMVKKKLEKSRKLNKSMNIKLSKTNIRKQVGGNLLTSILALGQAFGPTIAKTIELSALGGLASEGASQPVKKISGNGVKTGGFPIPQNKIDKLVANKHLLSTRQKNDILNALQSGSGVRIIPTKTQSGGFLGTLLASIGIPLALKVLTGKGAHKIGIPPNLHRGEGGPREWVYTPTGRHLFLAHGTTKSVWGKKSQPKKEKRKRSAVRTKQPIQSNSAYRGNTVNPKFHEEIPLSNHDLIEWCNIPINDALSRDEKVPDNHS